MNCRANLTAVRGEQLRREQLREVLWQAVQKAIELVRYLFAERQCFFLRPGNESSRRKQQEQEQNAYQRVLQPAMASSSFAVDRIWLIRGRLSSRISTFPASSTPAAAPLSPLSRHSSAQHCVSTAMASALRRNSA